MARAIAYVRVSKVGARGEDMVSPEIQLAAIRRHCQQHGHTIVQTLEDIDLSGKFWKRRQVELAVKMIERGEADVLAVWKLSRFARNRLDWALAVDRVESVGGTLESATEPMDTTTSAGRFQRGVMVELAAFESERIGESWKEAHALRVRRGLPHHGRPRFGYAYTRENGYEQDPVTAPVLRKLYLDYIAGAPLTDLAAVSGRYGGPKGVDGLRYLLDNGFGAGLIRYRKEILDGAHEGVVTEAEFKAYQRARKARATRQRSEKVEHPFSGLVYCWCGKRMWGNAREVRGVDHTRYLCAWRDADGHTSHTNSVSAAKVEEHVLEWLEREAAEGMNARAGAKPSHRAKDSAASARTGLLAALSRCASRLDALTEKFIDGEIDKDSYDRMGAKWRAEKAELEDRLGEIDAREAAPAAVSVVPDLIAQWGVMPGRVKRQILSSLVGRIEVGKAYTPERLEITPKWA